MKPCRICKTMFQPLARQIAKSDWICRPCYRADARAWRARRKAAGNPVKSSKMPREYHAAYERQYFADPANRKRAAENQKRYRNDPKLRDRHAARWLVTRAIKAGKLKRGLCEVCGAKKVQAHHDDYLKPLDVRWLCVKHHAEHHAKARGQQ